MQLFVDYNKNSYSELLYMYINKFKFYIYSAK